jgi:thioesterase domain-containing protein
MLSTIFVVHSAFDQAFISSLMEDRSLILPVHGLSIESENWPLKRTIEGMATELVKRIKDLQPNGPYHIAGYSLACVLAYEIAVQLIGADEKVNVVALLDNGYRPPTRYDESPHFADQRDKQNLLLLLQSSVYCDQQRLANVNELRSQTEQITYFDFIKLCRATSLFPAEYDKLSAIEFRENVRRLQSYHFSVAQYSIQEIPTSIDYLRIGITEKDEALPEWEIFFFEKRSQLARITEMSRLESARPAIEFLAGALIRNLRGSDRHALKLEASYQPLISLQTGKSHPAPLFCIPGAGGNVTSFLGLVDQLSELRQVYGIQPRGLDGRLVPHSTVSAAADYYLEAIDGIYPRKQIHLLGHSFGGWVAFELARKLHDRGCAPISLSIIDSSAPGFRDTSDSEVDMFDVSIEWIEILELVLDRRLNIKRETFESLNSLEQRKFIHRITVNEGLLHWRSESEVLRGPLRAFASALRTTYVPSNIYEGPVRLILVDDPKLDKMSNIQKQQQVLIEWTNWAPNLTYTHAPGNHLTLLKEPHVQVLAQILTFDDVY